MTEYTVKGCGPNRGSLVLDFRPGGNVLLGYNGVGKTLALGDGWFPAR